MNDWQLVQQYVIQGSEAAFSALVARHLGLVYSTAVHQVHDAQLAEEVTQAVFTLMARKAANFRQDVVLPGWLYRTARFVGATAARAEQRRRQREQKALLMQQDSGSDEPWRRLLPALDEALEQLREGERNAVILRFFEERSLREVGNMLRITEEAARKRVERSLEKLRVIFARRGFKASAVGLTTALGRHAAEAVPAGLSESIAGRAMTHAPAMTASLPDLVRQTLIARGRTRARRALALGAVVSVACLLMMGSMHRSPKPTPAPPEMDNAAASVEEPAPSPKPPELGVPEDEPQTAAGLRFQGFGEYRFFGFSTTEILNEVHDTFCLDLDRSGRWLLTSWASSEPYALTVTGFDGTNHYWVNYTSRLSTRPFAAEFTDEIPYEKGIHRATISLGAYPFDGWPVQRFVWFALGSGAFLSQPEAGRMPAPWRDGRTDMLSYAFTNEIETLAAWPNVPTAAQFVTCPSLAEGDLPDLVVPQNIQVRWFNREENKTRLVALSSNYSALLPRGEDLGLNAAPIQTNPIDPRLLMMGRFPMKSMTGEEQGWRLPALRPGQVAARYAVERWTNLFNATVPLQFKLEVFWPGFGNNTTNQNVAELYTGVVTNVTAIASTKGRPEVFGTLTVDDYRQCPAGARSPQHYNIDDKSWTH